MRNVDTHPIIDIEYEIVSVFVRKKNKINMNDPTLFSPLSYSELCNVHVSLYVCVCMCECVCMNSHDHVIRLSLTNRVSGEWIIA